jgi:hypothetical protein
MAGEAGGVAKAIAIEKRGGLEETARRRPSIISTCEISSHEISTALRSHLGPMASRAAIATTYTVACGADENMDH